ncbi:MAG: hypothetical protein H7A53_03345 [Akkermansiaceae bacterium]|nr:hypothetical protein [Akkermansiaceae bacterium]MCP5549921.1 hypothetical protein [Akkermansiaceae bacterium]
MPPRNAIDRKARRQRRVSDTRAINAFLGGLTAGGGTRADRRGWSLPWPPLLIAKFLVGVALMPVTWVTVETFFVSFNQAAIRADYWKTHEFWAFGFGVVAWLVLFFGLRNRFTLWLYVAGHELTHALFVLICRGNVKKVHISSDGGHILTNRNNFLISLSPYFFPFYSAVTIGIWWLTEWWFQDFDASHLPWLFGAIGFTWCFHLTFTIWMALRDDQPDLDQNGRLFSFMTIILVNTLIIAGMLIAASPNLDLRGFGATWWRNFSTFAPRLEESVREIVGIFV